MSRFVNVVMFCLMSSILLVVAAGDAWGVSTLSQQSVSQQSVSRPEGLDAASVEVTPEGDSTTDGELTNEASTTLIEPIEGDPQLVQDAQVEPRPRLSNRLLLTGTLVVVLLGQLSVLFGYLKINHATRGFYGGRLQSFSAVASVVVIAAGYFFYMTWKI